MNIYHYKKLSFGLYLNILLLSNSTWSDILIESFSQYFKSNFCFVLGWKTWYSTNDEDNSSTSKSIFKINKDSFKLILYFAFNFSSHFPNLILEIMY